MKIPESIRIAGVEYKVVLVPNLMNGATEIVCLISATRKAVSDMARYIDADKLIEFITKGLNNPDNTKAFGYDAIAILTEIEYAPTADVVEVVRCKVCRQYVSDILSDGVGYCNEYGMKMLENDFCSYGERKGDAE